MRRRSRRWRACVRVCVRAACGGCPRGASQCTRREPRRAAVGAAVRSQGLMWGDADFCHEAGPSVQMMRVRFCLEAAEKPSYPAAYGILAMRMSTFLLLLSYVVWPRHMMVRRATSARGGVVGPALRLMGRRDGLREASLRCLGGLPLCQPPSKQRRLGNPTRTMSNVRPCNQVVPRVPNLGAAIASVRH